MFSYTQKQVSIGRGFSIGNHRHLLSRLSYPQNAGGKDDLMKFKKTDARNRGTYSYKYTMTDDEGREYECTDVLKPGEDGVTEADIATLHRIDDGEVYNNQKNHRPRRTATEKRIIREWREKFIADFEERYGYTPHPDDVDYFQNEAFPKNWSISMNSPEEYGIDSDESTLLKSAIYEEDYDAVVIYHRALEIVDTLNEEQQEIFRRVFVEGEPQAEVARNMGIANRQSMTKRINRILAQIRKNL